MRKLVKCIDGGRDMNTLELYPTTDQRVIFCGDLHGEIDLLLASLASIGFNFEEDVLIAVGDLIDRGTDSVKTLAHFLNTPNFYSVVGNHEAMMLQSMHHNVGIRDWITNGGGWIESAGKPTVKQLADRINFPYAISVLHKSVWVGVTHAGLPYEIDDWNDMLKRVDSNDKKVIEAILWDREIISTPEWYTRKHVLNIDWAICGHTPVEDPIQIANRLYIDTGACFKGQGKLTLLEFIDNKPVYNFFEK